MFKSHVTPSPQKKPPPVENRRRFPRRAKPFSAVYFPTADARFPAVGLDIGGGGMCLLTQEPLSDAIREELQVIALVAEKPVAISASVCWTESVQHKGKDHFRYGLKLKAIADQDWDLIMRWAMDEHLAAEAPSSGTVLTATQRDSLIPVRTQHQIATALVKKARLDPTDESRLPLVEYKFEGYTMRKNVPFYKLTVRSKKSDHRTIEEFRTQVLVLVEGDGVLVLD